LQCGQLYRLLLLRRSKLLSTARTTPTACILRLNFTQQKLRVPL
jgi:hypothetical protein